MARAAKPTPTEPTPVPPPHSDEAEMSVLGAMLIDAAAVSRALELVGEADLYRDAHRRLYRAIANLHKRGDPPEMVLLTEQLKTAGDFDAVGGVAYLSQLWDYAPTAANLEHHAKIVRDKAQERRLARAAEQLAANPGDDGLRAAVGAILSSEEPQGQTRRFPGPMGVRDLLNEPEPDEQWLFEGLVPMNGNLLVGGYPKSHKTNFILEAGVSAASATPFLGRFNVPRQYRVAIILMEDRPHRIRRRLQRICAAHGIRLDDLDGWLYLWFRPPLRLGHAPTMREIAADVETYQLDVLLADNYALISDGNPDKIDDVSPQLQAFADLREIRPMTVGLVHHARKSSKDKDGDGSRLTDAMRGSGGFGAWYDAGVLLSRLSETSPVGIRAELRDYPSPEPFSFTVEDEFPAVPGSGRQYPDGYLRLRAADVSLQLADSRSHADQFKVGVTAWIQQSPGCTKAEVERNVKGKASYIRGALELLIQEGTIRYSPPLGPGHPGRCYPTTTTLVPPRPNLVPDVVDGPLVPLVPHPLGGDEGTGRGSAILEAAAGRGRTYPCASCGKFAFPDPETLCFRCRSFGAEKVKA